jgi:hypothetical protein
MKPAISTPRSRALERSQSWQERRASLLHEACTSVVIQIANGVKTMVAIKNAARRFRNRSLGNGRQLDLSAKSMYRIWADFKARGTSAFALRYVAGRKHAIDPLLLELVVQSAIRRSKNVSEILTEAGITDRKGRPSLKTIYRALPARDINRFLREERSLNAQRLRAEQKLVAINASLRDLRRAAEEKFLTKDCA